LTTRRKIAYSKGMRTLAISIPEDLLVRLKVLAARERRTLRDLASDFLSRGADDREAEADYIERVWTKQPKVEVE
jgi:hypothetical protein